MAVNRVSSSFINDYVASPSSWNSGSVAVSGSNRFLWAVVCLRISATGTTTVTASFNGTPMTELVSPILLSNTDYRMKMWFFYLKNPDAVTGPVTFSFATDTPDGTWCALAAAYSGVDQTTPFRTLDSPINSNANVYSDFVAVNSQDGDLVSAFMWAKDVGPGEATDLTPSTAGGQTNFHEQDQPGQYGQISALMQKLAVGGNTTVSWSTSPAVAYELGAMGLSLIPSIGGGGENQVTTGRRIYILP